MATFYHGGRSAVDPSKYYPESFEGEDPDLAKKERDIMDEEIRKRHPLTSPSRDSLHRSPDGKLLLRRPAMLCDKDARGNIAQWKYDEWTPGSIVLHIPERGYWVVPPGGRIDIDSTIPEKLIKSHAPHLLNEAEYAEQQAKLAKEKQQQTPAAKPGQQR